jgi:hypothetical protein
VLLLCPQLQANETPSKKDEGLAAAVASSITQTWQRRQQRQAEDDLEGCYTATPLPALPTVLRGGGRQRSRWQQMPLQQQAQQQQSHLAQQVGSDATADAFNTWLLCLVTQQCILCLLQRISCSCYIQGDRLINAIISC